VILIVADDLGYGDLSIYGATKIKTPHIDALARQGVRMTDACSTASVCQPSRYSFLTGENPNRIRSDLKGYDSYFREGQHTVATMLQSAGYRTSIFGKWHNGFNRQSLNNKLNWNNRDFLTTGAVKHSPLDLGFSTFFGTPKSHNEPPFVYVQTVYDDKGAPQLEVVDVDPTDPISEINNADAQKLTDPKLPENYGHGISIGGAAAHAERVNEYIDNVCAEKAIAELGQVGNRPFFMYLPFQAPHVPITPEKKWQGKSGEGPYGDYVQQFDEQVGLILAKLSALNLDKNTLVILTSDNGGLGPNNGHSKVGNLQGQKTDAWEGGHRVPLIVRWPEGKIPAGAVCDKLIGGTDLMATIAAATGVPIPPGAAIDSLNQLPLLRDPEGHGTIRNDMLIQATKCWMLRFTTSTGGKETKWAYIPVRGTGGQTVVDGVENGGGMYRAYRDFSWVNSDILIDPLTGKGKVKPQAPFQQLYNLSEDPKQQTNVIAANPSLAKDAHARLNTLVRSPNRAPEVKASLLRQVGEVGKTFSMVIAATTFADPDKDTLSYAVTGLPAGLSFAPLTRTIAGIPTASGTFPVQVSVNDGLGGSAATTFTLDIAGGVVPPPTPIRSCRDMIYTDFSADGVLKTGWEQRNHNTTGWLRSTGTTRNGSKSSYSIIFNAADAYAGLCFLNNAFDTQRYTSVSFWIHGGVIGNQHVEVQAVRAGGMSTGFPLAPLKKEQWQLITIPLADLGATEVTDLAHLRFVNKGTSSATAFYIDDLSFDVLTQPQTVLYAEGIKTGWTQQNHNCDGTLLNTKSTRTGSLRSYSIKFLAADAYAGMKSPDTLYNVGSQAALTFWINGGSVGGQKVEIQAVRAGIALPGRVLEPLQVGAWQQVTVYLDELGILGATDLSAIRFVNRSDRAFETPLYVDDVSFDESIQEPVSGTN
jgi:arylsulfatase A-like enzyme